MRLGQLARKLSISPSEIVEFLRKQNISIESDSNARMEEEHALIVTRHFAPSLLDEIQKENIIQPDSKQENEAVAEIITTSSNELPERETIDGGVDGKIEVIKAPKTELPGLKVLGKIDLPEPKKKETPKAPENTEAPLTETPATPHKTSHKDQRKTKNFNKQREWKNPIATQREREQREAEEKRKELLKKEKELRALHYQQKVKKIALPTKSVKKVDEPLEEMVIDQRPTPRTWLGKFLRWLSTP